MKKLNLHKNQVYGMYSVLVGVLFVALLFGYTVGRYDQMQRTRAVLEVIPEVNCGQYDLHDV